MGIDGQFRTMKNSTLLKWTNSKNNKNKNGNKNWIHQPEALTNGHVVYLVKFLGYTEVSESKGIEVVKEAVTKLKFNQQLKKTDGSKINKVELTISVDGVAIQNPKTKKISFQYALHQISYCADDKAEKRFFSFIAKESNRDAHTCFVFISDKLAEEITLTIGQAFDLAYKKFLETTNKDSELKEQVSALRREVETLRKENKELKQQLSHVATLDNSTEISRYLNENRINLNTQESPDRNSLITNENRSSPALILPPPVPPRNVSNDVMLNDVSDEENFDFDPRAEEKIPSFQPAQPAFDNLKNPKSILSSSPEQTKVLNSVKTQQSVLNFPNKTPVSNGQPVNGFKDLDDDFDPRAQNESPVPIIANTAPPQLNGVNHFPAIVPPPCPTRDPRRNRNSLVVTPNNQFDEMQVGFTRGLTFGSADRDFTLESLDPLKN